MAYVPRKHHTVSQCEKLYQKKKKPTKIKKQTKKTCKARYKPSLSTRHLLDTFLTAFYIFINFILKITLLFLRST